MHVPSRCFGRVSLVSSLRPSPPAARRFVTHSLARHTLSFVLCPALHSLVILLLSVHWYSVTSTALPLVPTPVNHNPVTSGHRFSPLIADRSPLIGRTILAVARSPLHWLSSTHPASPLIARSPLMAINCSIHSLIVNHSLVIDRRPLSAHWLTAHTLLGHSLLTHWTLSM